VDRSIKLRSSLLCAIMAVSMWLGSSAAQPKAPAPPRPPRPPQPPAAGAPTPTPTPLAPPPLAASATGAPAADLGPPQTILAPGLYLFQTRTRDGSCNDAPRTGYVTSSVATLDGVPGSRSMTMQLLNSKYWPSWKIEVSIDNVLIGSANMLGGKDESAGSSRFELRLKKERFQGVGSRNYPSQVDGKKTQCTLNYDALLKLLD
jgi:hypothetical protein